MSESRLSRRCGVWRFWTVCLVSGLVLGTSPCAAIDSVSNVGRHSREDVESLGSVYFDQGQLYEHPTAPNFGPVDGFSDGRAPETSIADRLNLCDSSKPSSSSLLWPSLSEESSAVSETTSSSQLLRQVTSPGASLSGKKYPDYCLKPDQISVDRRIPPLSESTRKKYPYLQYLQIFFISRHAARTPSGMHHCWEGWYEKMKPWNCNYVESIQSFVLNNDETQVGANTLDQSLGQQHTKLSDPMTTVQSQPSTLSSSDSLPASSQTYNVVSPESNSLLSENTSLIFKKYIADPRHSVFKGTCREGGLVDEGYVQSKLIAAELYKAYFEEQKDKTKANKNPQNSQNSSSYMAPLFTFHDFLTDPSLVYLRSTDFEKTRATISSILSRLLDLMESNKNERKSEITKIGTITESSLIKEANENKKDKNYHNDHVKFTDSQAGKPSVDIGNGNGFQSTSDENNTVGNSPISRSLRPPIPLYTTDSSLDNLLPNPRFMPELRTLVNQAKMSPQYKALISEEQKIIQEINRITGRYIKTLNGSRMLDCLMTSVCNDRLESIPPSLLPRFHKTVPPSSPHPSLSHDDTDSYIQHQQPHNRTEQQPHQQDHRHHMHHHGDQGSHWLGDENLDIYRSDFDESSSTLFDQVIAGTFNEYLFVQTYNQKAVARASMSEFFIFLRKEIRKLIDVRDERPLPDISNSVKQSENYHTENQFHCYASPPSNEKNSLGPLKTNAGASGETDTGKSQETQDEKKVLQNPGKTSEKHSQSPTGNTAPILLLIGVHDITIITMLCALAGPQLLGGVWPPYASNLIFEFYHTDPTQPSDTNPNKSKNQSTKKNSNIDVSKCFFRLIYNSIILTPKLPGCEPFEGGSVDDPGFELCGLSAFFKATDWAEEPVMGTATSTTTYLPQDHHFLDRDFDSNLSMPPEPPTEYVLLTDFPYFLPRTVFSEMSLEA